ncbi:hypothetical protein [Flavobacterium sp. LC2016-12]|uniref:hypothetical protein n=1 Tax=Flavobacterium sp. LC2016-12 TaxID=2783794 RepID=UPI00188C504E|nr:hypothetical protein [Flavobacterium sp. LC2016-12]MBF4465387.1 hypothetical protein [Flavobacterium sp. LC2016-12]
MKDKMSIPEKLYSEKLSNYQESIKVLYLVDDDFKTMCDDYCCSKINVEKFKKKMQEDFHLKVEYENLTKELEEEIVQYIEKNME